MNKSITLKAITEAMEGATYWYIAALEDGYEFFPMSYIGETEFSVWRNKNSWSLVKDDPKKAIMHNMELAVINNVHASHSDIAKVFMSIIKMF